ncbi:nasB [Symbiodinium sp. CCMP2456]|nr:nasB [Symbiodinium sp. CCMP2456]
MAGKKVVVVGHGPIGHAFIEKLAEREAGFEITVVCEEPRPAYNRVMLTQYFLDCDGDKHDQMKLSYWSEEELKSKNVKLVYGRATSIDRDNKSVAYSKVSHGGSSVDADTDSLKYDILVLCTGSFCFVPPTPGFVLPEKKNPQWPDDPASRPEGVFVYRTIEDLEALIAAAKKSKRAAVIGGGLLGLEAAKAVYDLEMESHVVEMAPYLMPTQLNEEAGKALERKISSLGIHVHSGAKINEAVLDGGKDGKKLVGGVLVGDAKDYPKLLQICKKGDLGGAEPESLAFRRPPPGQGAVANDGGDGTGIAEDDVICTCLNVTKGEVVNAIKDKDCLTVPQIKKCTKAGTGCGGCCTPVGEVPKVLSATLKALGKEVKAGISECFPYTRQELFNIFRVKEIKTFQDAIEKVAVGGNGSELDKPVIASILANLWNDSVLKSGRDQIQDTNDRFLANIQKTGTYSVIPRCAGGDITPDELIAIGTVAKKYGLWTKVTGAQRLGMYGAPVHELPSIFKELVDAGLESGHAYGKALRTVKSCVGSTWCRYGQQDSVSMACTLENRYKGLRAPHKIKMAVSGCLRECAEAQGKDVGCIATNSGYNLYLCGNGGAKPRHAQLFASSIDEETCLKYIDRFLMFYCSTAKHLQRTAPWLEELPGGIEYLRKVIIDDCLGICEDLEGLMRRNVEAYKCEWKEVVYDEELQKKFQQFVNTKETQDTEQLEYVNMRKQRHPATYDLPDIKGAAAFSKEKAEESWQWYPVGKVQDFPQAGGLAMKHGDAEVAVFNLSHRQDESDKWFATQNLCPFKQVRVISRGLVGEPASGAITVADPVYKTVYDLRTGCGITSPDLNLSTFRTRVTDGTVEVKLPAPEEYAKALQTASRKAVEESGTKAAKVMGKSKPFDANGKHVGLDW